MMQVAHSMRTRGVWWVLGEMLMVQNANASLMIVISYGVKSPDSPNSHQPGDVDRHPRHAIR